MQAPSLTWDETGGLRVLTDRLLHDEAGIAVAFTSRCGGASSAPYASLNLAFHVGDDPADVLTNRRRLCDALGLEFGKMTCAQQVHGTDVAIVGDGEMGRGRDSYDASIPATDALATDKAGVPLAMFFADCVPLVLVDSRKRAVGVAHAGWKGVLGNIAGALIERMGDAFGSSPGDLLAYIGPAISSRNYEVGSELIAAFGREFPDFVTLGDTHLDLPYLVQKSLDEAGVPRQNVAAADMCTIDKSDLFYSHRSEGGITGRHAAIVAIAN